MAPPLMRLAPVIVVLLTSAVSAGAVLSQQAAPAPAAIGVPAALLAAQLATTALGTTPLGEFFLEEDHEAATVLLGAGAWVRDEAPADTDALLARCPNGTERDACLTRALTEVLETRGPEAAFTMLDEAGRRDADVSRQSHPLAHVLGRHALALYGNVQDAMHNCSYKVFAGCFHGALQGHFEGLPAVEASAVVDLCPTDNLFRQYTCLHGAGHGLFLATQHDLHRSLALCDALVGDFARGSCYGGVFMENVVGYFDSLSGAAHSHGDGGAALPYAVDDTRPQYPCDAVAPHTQPTCWLMQTSLILHFNHGDFQAAARVCDGILAQHILLCYRSLGRDAAPYTNRDVATSSRYCAYGDAAERDACIRGFSAESVLHYATPEAGIAVCKAMAEVDKVPCYEEVAGQGASMWSAEAMAALCAKAEPGYEGACRRGAHLAPL